MWNCNWLVSKSFNIKICNKYIDRKDFDHTQREAGSFPINLSDKVSSLIKSEMKDVYVKKHAKLFKEWFRGNIANLNKCYYTDKRQNNFDEYVKVISINSLMYDNYEQNKGKGCEDTNKWIQGTEWWYNKHNYSQKFAKLTAYDDKMTYLINLIHIAYISYNVYWFVKEKSYPIIDEFMDYLSLFL